MNPRKIWARILITVGNIAMLAGAVDLLEGSLVILPGSGLVALGTFLDHCERRFTIYRTVAFILIAVGVGALFGLSAVGGIGGASGHSYWWGVLVLPYLIGWSLGIWGPGSPRWVLWLGMAISLWYLTVAVLIQRHPEPHGNSLVSIVLAALGLLTIGGCLRRLGQPPSGPGK